MGSTILPAEFHQTRSRVFNIFIQKSTTGGNWEEAVSNFKNCVLKMLQMYTVESTLETQNLGGGITENKLCGRHQHDQR